MYPKSNYVRKYIMDTVNVSILWIRYNVIIESTSPVYNISFTFYNKRSDKETLRAYVVRQLDPAGGSPQGEGWVLSLIHI
jgi:hypothetical protein